MINGELLSSLLWIIGYVLTFETMVLFVCSFIHYNRDDYKTQDEKYRVSVIIPCYNEAKTLQNCVSGLLNQNYKNYEIIIVDDGSTDKTLEVAEELKETSDKIKVYSKVNGGKASALNYGLQQASGEIIISLDADSIFLKNTLSRIVAPFTEKELSSVCGNIKVSNSESLLGKLQSLEYISGLNIQRRAFAHLGCIQVISGAIGAFKKDALIAVGGYSKDTLVEDMDITVTLAKYGYKIEYIGDAIAYTEVPESVRDFYKQRYRWIFGTFQIIKKHRKMLFNSTEFGIMGLVGLPYILFSMIMNVILTFIVMFSVLYVLYTHIYMNTLVYVLQVLIIQTILFSYTLFIDNENKKLAFKTPYYIFLYKPFLNIITLKALVDYIIGRRTNWNKFERLGKNKIAITQ